MTSKNLVHPSTLGPSAVAITEAAPNSAGPVPECRSVAARTSTQKVDDLLRAFSDTAYSIEEEDHPWESWNYTRLSTF